MSGKVPHARCAKKVVAAIMITQLFMGTPAVSFAAGDNLRPSAAKNSARVFDVRRDLNKDGGTTIEPVQGFIHVQSNNAGLFRGAQTGGLNTDLAFQQGSNGNLNDHSETRERLEGAVKDMVVAMLSARKTILDRLTRDKTYIPKAYNLKLDRIKRNSTLLETEREQQMKQAKAEFEAHIAGLQPNADKALAAVEQEYFVTTKEQMSRLERATGLDAQNQQLVRSWVLSYCGNVKKIFAEEPLAELVAKITNLVKNQELKADIAFSKAYFKMFGRYPYKMTTLCLGEKKSQYDANDPTKAWKILERDLRQMLSGISREDARIIGLRLAYEPRWVIGADTIPADVLAKIDDTHGFIKKISKELLGETLAVDYGAAVKATTIESILALENVDGVLIGSAANDPATLKPIVEKAVEYVRNHPAKKFNLGMNWKANDSANGLKELDAFVAMFKAIPDLDLITVTIATPNVTTTRAAMDKVESYFAKASLKALGQTVVETEALGNGFTSDILAPVVPRNLSAIEALFREETRNGDSYVLLKKDGVAFAIAKENAHDQTLMTVPVDDLTDLKAKEAYYASLLESVSLMTTKTGRFVELIEEKSDRLMSYLSGSVDRKRKLEAFSLNTLSGTKYWYGRERFFQLEYKPANIATDVRSTMLTPKQTERAIGRGVSFIIQPTYYVLVNGYGTIGAKAAAAARKSGFFVMATARSVKVDSRDAYLKDYPIVLSDTKNAADFEKNGMQVAGGINEVLDIVDFVIDGTPAKVGADNIKNIYSKFPNLRVILEGGEKAAPGIASFSSGTNYWMVRDSKIVRVVSCNTTGMARTFGEVAKQLKQLAITNLLMRRAADPGDEKGENPDGVSLLPVSHHGDDLRAVLSREANANIVSLRTTAVVTPTTHFHVHSGTIKGPGLTAAKVQAILKAQSRVALVQFPGGELKTPVLFDIFNSMIKDANHPFIVVAQVEESGNPDEVAITIAVPQESNVVPENVNALHAMAGLAGKDAAIRLVDEVLNIPQIKQGLEQRLPVKIQKDGGEIYIQFMLTDLSRTAEMKDLVMSIKERISKELNVELAPIFGEMNVNKAHSEEVKRIATEVNKRAAANNDYLTDVHDKMIGADVALKNIMDRYVLTQPYEYTLILTDADLFSPEKDFLFSRTMTVKTSGGMRGEAIVSTYRFETADRKLFQERMTKQILNAVGKMIGLPPGLCRPDCVMAAATFVEDVDKKSSDFCPICIKRIASLKDGGEAEVVIPMDYLTLDDVDVKGRTVLYRGDFNSPVENGKLKVTERLKANAVTIKELQQKGARVVIMVHQGRPGDADYLESLDQYAGLVSAEIKAPARYVDDLYGAAAQQAIKAMKNGDVLVLKNVRSWDPETDKKMTIAKQAQSAMVKALSPWIDFEVLDAFSIAHRNNISVVGFQAAGIPLIAGRLMEREIKGNYRAALVGEKPYIASFGGAKIDDYLGVIRKGLKEGTYSKVHMSGLLGELALVAQGYNLGTPTMDFLAEQFKDFSDKKYGSGMEGIVKAIRDILAEYPDLIEIPEDLAYLDANGKRAEVVLTSEHKTKPVADTLIGDIGTQTANKFAAQLKEAKTVFVKGPWGNYKNVEFVKASDIIARALKESGAYLITGGGDTNVLFDRLGMMQRINYFSLAGGAFLEFMEGKALPGMVALDASAKEIVAGSRKLGVSRQEFLKHRINDKFVFVKAGGESFGAFINSVSSQKEKKDGALSGVVLTPEIIKDSRGKPTVRVNLKINGVTVKGEVPAGASKGEDEAATVGTEQAVRNIEEVIAPLLKNSGLDIGTYDGLRKAEQLIIDAAGENFATLGANATVPVSWALWRAAAALNNMSLWQYIRANEPGVIGEGTAYPYMNIYNGGLHAIRGDEKLGRDRIDIQEIMIVPVGSDRYAERLAMGDKIDRALKELLSSLFDARDIMRADEAGFSVKGLGQSDRAIALVIEAIRKAGYEPGKDVMLALDPAATSFYNTQKQVYEFQGKELSSKEMVKFYVDLVEQYPGLFISIEDGMAENDWAGWSRFTAEMEKRGIDTIGDDVFVTQKGRLQRGIEQKTATAILIKVNQNGTVGGTLDVMKLAKQNNMKAVVSHRSGETLDDGIADLAYAAKVLGLKTGDPQPAYDFPNTDQLVRRNKYLRMIAIQEKEAVMQKAVIVGPEFFAAGGSINALKQALVLNKQIKFVIYGEAAESIKAELADISVLTAPTLAKAVTMLKSFDVPAQNIVLVGSAGTEDADAVKDIKQIPVKGISTIALAQALNALLADPATQAAFTAFDKATADLGINAAVVEQIEQIRRDEEEFFNKV